MEGNLPSPNFSQGSNDFLQFSSTPIEGKNFKPKWGKKNRQDNWNRFGNSFHQEGETGDSPVSHGHGHYRGRGGVGWNGRGRGHHGGGWQGGGYHNRGGGRGGGRGFNNSWHGGGGGGRGRFNNSFNQNRSHKAQDSGEGYFHPAMLEDPWAELESYGCDGGGSQEDSHHWDVPSQPGGPMSESMIAQVGDTLNDRNEKLLETTENEETLAKVVVDGDETKDTEQVQDSN